MLIDTIQRLSALIDAGLYYGKDVYDLERYQEMKELMPKLLNDLTDQDLTKFFPKIEGYPTPKVDNRAFILNENDEILLVQESRNQEWSLPGGFMEIGLSAKENMLKEVKEETGFESEIIRLLAVFDTNKWQKHHFQYYKFCFHVKLLSGSFQTNNETIKMDYFSLEQLPEKLSTLRNSKEQLEILFKMVKQQTQHID
jgi:ADP-ribose pyrophosphatase YjhB (NUDIX family)